MDRTSHLFATVNCSVGKVRVCGYRNINRAVNGDLVVLKVAEIQQTRDLDVYLSDEELEEEEEQKNRNNVETDAQNDNCQKPSQSGKKKESNVQQPSQSVNQVGGATAEKEGQVVGILKRNWKEYSGTLVPLDESQSKLVGVNSDALQIILHIFLNGTFF